MERYFEKFRTIQYANTVVRDITQRAVILNSVYNNPLLYYPYDIREGERPDAIAGRYYKDEYLAWTLYFSNKIVDPYHDWYLDERTFDEFIVKKYGSFANATTKIKYYRNNWYNDQNPTISAAAYSILDPSVTKFYEPVPINDEIVNSPRQYRRREVDWKLQTNSIARYSVANGSSFANDEVVDVRFSLNETGTGQVTFANTTTVVLQHLSGVVTTGTISGSSYLYGRESQTNTVFTAANSVANTIPATETQYWSPVTYYEHEQEINERNKSILVLQSQYTTDIAKQLKALLK